MKKRIETLAKDIYKKFPSEELGTKGMIDNGKRKIFIDGVNWADNHPSEYTINKILSMHNEWLDYLLKNTVYVSFYEFVNHHWEIENIKYEDVLKP